MTRDEFRKLAIGDEVVIGATSKFRGTTATIAKLYGNGLADRGCTLYNESMGLRKFHYKTFTKVVPDWKMCIVPGSRPRILTSDCLIIGYDRSDEKDLAALSVCRFNGRTHEVLNVYTGDEAEATYAILTNRGGTINVK